jgi:hypothetical protein
MEVFMKKYIFLILMIHIVLIGCSKKKIIISNEIAADDYVAYEEALQTTEETNRIVENNVIKNSITNYFYNEILNGNNDLSFQHGSEGVINFFGKPSEENRIPTSFYFEGGIVIQIHELIYNDLTHRYYVFESGRELYYGFFVTKPLDRLNSVEIGDTSEKLLSTFSDKYYTWDNVESIKENISYYTDPVVCEIQFVIKEGIIKMIACNFLLI